MKELEEVFVGRGEVKGFIFIQVGRSPKAYMYEVQILDIDSKKVIATHYEVFLRKERIQPNLGIANVTYPTSKAFGKYAWTFISYEQAVKKFKSVR